MPSIQPHQEIVQLPRLAFRVIDDVGVLVQPKAQLAHMLNPVAAFIWARLKTPAQLSDLAAAVAQEFQVGGDVALADCREFIDDLQRRGLIEVRG
jgi:hypothetical protein